jgi:CheY-like chemotaxis protein
VDPEEVLKELCDLLSHTLWSGITIRMAAEPGLPALLADKAQLETVLLNLATNARDAMPQGGALIFSAVCERVAQDRENPTLKAGSYIRLSVADGGIGMDAATLLRATEPFFTTKPKGQGTGLGLPMAQGFAEQSGGALSIRSEPGRGTIVSIWLPQAEGAAPGQPETIAPSPVGAAADLDRKRHILVVDDNELVREVLMMSLEEAGFAAEGAEDASRALVYMDQQQAVDALITDFTMPGITGLDLIREVRRRKPTLPTILLTGHVGDIATAPIDRTAGTRVIVLQKPVRTGELIDRLTAAIDEAG